MNWRAKDRFVDRDNNRPFDYAARVQSGGEAVVEGRAAPLRVLR